MAGYFLLRLQRSSVLAWFWPLFCQTAKQPHQDGGIDELQDARQMLAEG